MNITLIISTTTWVLKSFVVCKRRVGKKFPEGLAVSSSTEIQPFFCSSFVIFLQEGNEKCAAFVVAVVVADLFFFKDEKASLS